MQSGVGNAGAEAEKGVSQGKADFSPRLLSEETEESQEEENVNDEVPDDDCPEGRRQQVDDVVGGNHPIKKCPRHKTQNEKEKPGRTNEKRSGANVRLESFGSESGQHVLCPGDEEFFRSGFFAQGVGCFEAGFRKVGGGHVFKGLVTVALRFLNGADQKDILRFRQRERQSVIVRLGKKHGDSAFLMIHSIVSGDTAGFQIGFI